MEVYCEVCSIPRDRHSDADWLRNNSVTHTLGFPLAIPVALTVPI